jgi:hypothetical protein
MKQPTIFSIIIIIIILYGACSPKVQEEGDSNDSDDVNNGNGSDTKSVDFYASLPIAGSVILIMTIPEFIGTILTG